MESRAGARGKAVNQVRGKAAGDKPNSRYSRLAFPKRKASLKQ